METPLIYISDVLREAYQNACSRYRIILFAAPCGCGKTTAAAALMSDETVFRIDMDAEGGPDTDIPPDCTAVLIDNLHLLKDTALQQEICALLRSRQELRFVLLTRGGVPGWLTPFRYAEVMTVITMEQLMLDAASVRELLKRNQVTLKAGELAALISDTGGYPLILRILLPKLRQSGYTAEARSSAEQELFFYYDDQVFLRMESPLRALLLALAPFEPFNPELARMVSGEQESGIWLEELMRSTSMLQAEGLDTYRFRPIFRDYLRWKQEHSLTEEQCRTVLGRGALYYEMQNDVPDAMAYYSKAGDMRKVSQLLEKNARLHAGMANYYEMADYYFALPREEVLSSPFLICAMSMVTALSLDYDASEAWYRELQSYAARLKRSDAEYREARIKLAWLDISLPQRGNDGLIETITSLYRVMSDKSASVPRFSVTSNLPSVMNGGKDFCQWSKQDDLIYITVGTALEAVMGQDGVGLKDCAVCESKFEKGEDVSSRLLTLMSRLGEIQAKGSPDIEFAAVGLLARAQLMRGNAQSALDSVRNLRAKFVSAGHTRFLPNMDAMICRVELRTGDLAAVGRWLAEEAPGDDKRIWSMWRYQYLTRAMAQAAMGEDEAALLTLAKLSPYFERCGRVMDMINLRILSAVCLCRLGHDRWRKELSLALDSCREYSFVTPVAQYGAAVLPLLRESGWDKDGAFLQRLIEAARAQAVFYPRFLRCERGTAEPLSPAEMQVLRLLCADMSNNEICELLDIKLPTVKTHVSHIMQKLGVSRRSEAKAAAEKLRII